LNAHVPTEGKCDDSKDSFYEDSERVFHYYSKFHIKILFGKCNAKLGRGVIFKPTVGNESLY
jgi:hypothetical protein